MAQVEACLQPAEPIDLQGTKARRLMGIVRIKMRIAPMIGVETRQQRIVACLRLPHRVVAALPLGDDVERRADLRHCRIENLTISRSRRPRLTTL